MSSLFDIDPIFFQTNATTFSKLFSSIQRSARLRQSQMSA